MHLSQSSALISKEESKEKDEAGENHGGTVRECACVCHYIHVLVDSCQVDTNIAILGEGKS